MWLGPEVRPHCHRPVALGLPLGHHAIRANIPDAFIVRTRSGRGVRVQAIDRTMFLVRLLPGRYPIRPNIPDPFIVRA